jgi:predicted AAA+ superfamily ATPase
MTDSAQAAVCLPQQSLAQPILDWEQAAALLLYGSIFIDPAAMAFLRLVQLLAVAGNPKPTVLRAYGDWFSALATSQLSWPAYLVQQILRHTNPFSQQAQQQAAPELPRSLKDAAAHDLRILQQFFQLSPQQLGDWVATYTQQQTVVWQPEPTPVPAWTSLFDWGTAVEALAHHYRQQGTGLFAEYRAARWQGETLRGIPHPDPIGLEALTGYETQKMRLRQNTEALLMGAPALHVLLYGSRGSGKSSLVKALLNRYSERGLRLVEVPKAELYHLPTLVERLRPLPQKFVIFVDDLSFEADDEAFKALKVVLEGTLTARPTNVVVYATSNRRHLVREYFSDRPRPGNADEVHAWDTVQEQLSFSDRFGLTLTFDPADQTTYLEIVFALAQQAQIALPAADLEFRALQWATRHNGRSGRTARQFIDAVLAEQMLKG